MVVPDELSPVEPRRGWKSSMPLMSEALRELLAETPGESLTTSMAEPRRDAGEEGWAVSAALRPAAVGKSSSNAIVGSGVGAGAGNLYSADDSRLFIPGIGDGCVEPSETIGEAKPMEGVYGEATDVASLAVGLPREPRGEVERGLRLPLWLRGRFGSLLRDRERRVCS